MNDLQKILVVDDEPSICHGCKLILSENGMMLIYHIQARKDWKKYQTILLTWSFWISSCRI